MLKMCDCIAGAILGYIRDNSDESKLQHSLHTLINSLAQCLLGFRKNLKTCMVKIINESGQDMVIIYEEVRESGGLGVFMDNEKYFEFDPRMKSIVKRFLFNANPIAFCRSDQTFTTNSQNLSVLFIQFEENKSLF
jgi:hypothetical protein